MRYLYLWAIINMPTGYSMDESYAVLTFLETFFYM